MVPKWTQNGAKMNQNGDKMVEGGLEGSKRPRLVPRGGLTQSHSPRFLKKGGPKWIPPGGLGKSGGPKKAILAKKAVRAQRFVFDLGEKTAKTAKM